MGNPCSKRARRRSAAIVRTFARKHRLANEIKTVTEMRAHIHRTWCDVPNGVLMYHLRRLHSARPICDSFVIEPRLYSRGPSFGFVWDAPMGLVLRRNDLPFACVGFRIEGDVVTVHQMQGKRMPYAFSVPFVWSHVLLDALCYTVYRLRYRRVEVVPAAFNRYAKYLPEKEFQRYMRHYDETALSLGFTRAHDQQNFRLVLR